MGSEGWMRGPLGPIVGWARELSLFEELHYAFPKVGS